MNDNFIAQLDSAFQTNRVPDKNGDYFKEEDYRELQRNLVLYKEGNQEATTYIVSVFHPFVTKYVRFIINGDLPYSKIRNSKGEEHSRVSPTISKFVSLFIEKGIHEDKKKVFSYTCYKIKSLFSKYESGDIYNELVLALLNMANKYKITELGEEFHKANGTFHMYVSKCFHWEAYRYLKKLINDPLTHKEVMQLCDQFDDMEEGDTTMIFMKDENSEFAFEEILSTTDRALEIRNSSSLTIKENEVISVYDTDSLNFNWTNGITCGELFKHLSSYEREIIILSFIKNKTDIEIGDIYGFHRATINAHKKKAVLKIKELAESMNIIN